MRNLYAFPGQPANPFPVYTPRTKPRLKRRELKPEITRSARVAIPAKPKVTKGPPERPYDPRHPEAFAAFLGRTHQRLPDNATEAQRTAYTKARDRWNNRQWTWRERRMSRTG